MATGSGGSRFLTLDDPAAALATSMAQAYALVLGGDLPAIKIGGRGQWRVERTALEDYMEQASAPAGAYVDQHLRGGRD